jgi:hypothetical protein
MEVRVRRVDGWGAGWVVVGAGSDRGGRGGWLQQEGEVLAVRLGWEMWERYKR